MTGDPVPGQPLPTLLDAPFPQPGRSRSSSLPTHVKGRAWRHRLLRAPGMSERFSTPTKPQAPRMLDEPLGSPLPSTSLLHLSILRTGSKQILNEPDPLSLRTYESVTSSFALLHLLKPLFMGLERLTQLV